MIVVVADDLSGAAELAGVAGDRGLNAEVQTRFVPETGAEVVCLDTGSRALPAQDAERVARRAIREVMTASPEWIYLKFDSVLRGNVRVELQAALETTGRSTALLVTANPSRGRVIRGGVYLVDGVPLHETSFATDPEHPRATSRVRDLLGGDPAGVEVPDVADATDLARLAGEADDDALLAGSAEFFAAVLAARVPRGAGDATRTPTADASAPERGDRPITLVACGSLASWPTRREEARERGIRVFDLGGELSDVAGTLERDRIALIGIGSSPGPGAAAPSVLVEMLAERTADVAGMVPLGRLLLEGGATAAAVVRRLRWERFLCLPGFGPGVGALRPVDRDVPTLLIKPGSYPWPPTLW